MSPLPIRYRFSQKGQALLLILLVMSVVLTVTLSVVARSVTDITISKSEDNSIRAFNAAEAGVEKAIIGTTGSETLQSGASYTSVSTESGGGANSFIYPSELQAGESATFWFVSHNSSGDITCRGGVPCLASNNLVICWGESGTGIDSYTPAIELEVFYENSTPIGWDSSPQDFSDLRIARGTADPYHTRNDNNHFDDEEGGLGACSSVGGKSFAFRKQFSFTSSGLNIPTRGVLGGILITRVTMFYNTNKIQPIAAIFNVASGSVPAQGRLIQSTGVSGESQRKLSIFQGYPEPPFAFNSAIFSGSSIQK